MAPRHQLQRARPDGRPAREEGHAGLGRGRIHNTRWTDNEGVERFGYEIIADDVQFLNRPRRSDASETGEPVQEELV